MNIIEALVRGAFVSASLMANILSYAATLDISVAHTCDEPYLISIGLKNSGDETLILNDGFMPWNPKGKTVIIGAYAVIGGLKVPLKALHPIMDMPPAKVTLLPEKWITDSFDLRDYYDFKKNEIAVVVFTIKFPTQAESGSTYSIKGPIVIVAYPKKRILWKSCPVFTTLVN